MAPSDANPEALPDGYRKPSHGHGILKPFQKGHVANPKGLGGEYRDVLSLARKHSKPAMQKLIDLMTSADERVALMAADKVLERAWGKVKEAAAETGDPGAIERRAQMRAEVIKMLQALAVPEPLTVDNAVPIVEPDPAERQP